MNKYPTIFVSFKNIEGKNINEAIVSLNQLAVQLCSDFLYVLESDKVAINDKIYIDRVLKYNSQPTELCYVLQVISHALEAHWDKQVIILIDEYDVPINCAEQNGYYNEMVGLMRNMLGSALKGNRSLKFSILTGCLRIAKESIFTGLNNFKCYDISNKIFADKFGFTDSEVKYLLKEAGLEDREEIVKEWYNGYCFGENTKIFCPWDVLQYIYDVQINNNAIPQEYWANTSGNDIVCKLINDADRDYRDKIELLMSGCTIEENIAYDMTYDSVYENKDNIWSMLYLTGYLTKAAKQPENDNVSLVIPNKEVLNIFIKIVSKWLRDVIKKYDLKTFVKKLWRGDSIYMQKFIAGMLYNTISYFDNNEKYYHGFITGLIQSTGLITKSNYEFGLGRPDVVIEDGAENRAIIIEVKCAKNFEDIEELAQKALIQIDDRKYASGLDPHISHIIKYGIAFWKKECVVKICKEERL